MKVNRLSKVGVFVLVFLFAVDIVNAQQVDNELQTRAELDVSFKPLDKLKISFLPQLRYDEDFTLDKYLLELEAEYKVFSFLQLGTSYSLVANQRKTKDTEYFNRYSFSAKTKKDFGRFESSFRLKYSNYADDDVVDKKYLRYKAGLEYDISNCKLTPSVAAELYQQLNGGGLYKMRYSVGADYKLFKNNYITTDYKLDYFDKKYLNRHIISLGYKLKF